MLRKMPSHFLRGGNAEKWYLVKWTLAAGAAVMAAKEDDINLEDKVFDFMPWNWSQGTARSGMRAFGPAMDLPVALWRLVDSLTTSKKNMKRGQELDRIIPDAVRKAVPGGTELIENQEMLLPTKGQAERQRNLAQGQRRGPLSSGEKYRRSVFPGSTREQALERELQDVGKYKDPAKRRSEIRRIMDELKNGKTPMGKLFEFLGGEEKKDEKPIPYRRRTYSG
jgi:hypothetical protein